MPRLPACSRPAEAGFSLVEVMAAVAIMAVALVALYRGAGGSQRAAQFIEAHLGARLIAQSLIEDVRRSAQVSADRRKGDSGMYHWQLIIEPIRVPGIEAAQGYRFYHLQAQITWQAGGSFVLDALKLGK